MKFAPEPHPFPDPQETLEQREISEKVQEALGKLKPNTRMFYISIIIKSLAEMKSPLRWVFLPGKSASWSTML